MLGHCRSPEDRIGEQGLLKQLTCAMVERALNAGPAHHLGHEKRDPAGRSSGSSRNGATRKSINGKFGEAESAGPRDRNRTFEPWLVAKHQTRFTGFDDNILSMYARGVTTRETRGQLEEGSSVQLSPALIAEVTGAVLEEVTAWQNRPLEPLYPIVFLDALMMKMRHEGRVDNRAMYVAIGIDLDGRKDVLRLWTSAHEGAKFWLQMLTDLKNRGVKVVLIARVDGLKGFPQAQVPFCVVRLVRASLDYLGWKERKAVAGDLKADYRAATEPEAEQQLAHFAERWDARRLFKRRRSSESDLPGAAEAGCEVGL
ncbi:MAG TPA: IS256 family transposase [Solibacterales bacterium]|nr:IS256 family transposase [Bryobacterales bacterium]